MKRNCNPVASSFCMELLIPCSLYHIHTKMYIIIIIINYYIFLLSTSTKLVGVNIEIKQSVKSVAATTFHLVNTVF